MWQAGFSRWPGSSPGYFGQMRRVPAAMGMRAIGTFVVVCVVVSSASAQVAIGIQGGPLFFNGLSGSASKSLGHTGGFTFGAQLLEGGVGETGVRVELDLCQRTYDLLARSPEKSWLTEELRCASSLMRFSMDVRWPINEKVPVYFDLGPLIGVEVHEKRTGIVFNGDRTNGRADATVIDEVETGFAIRDIRLRFGLSMEFPLSEEWRFTTGAHMGPGFTTWARDHGYLTLDGQLRVGVVRTFGRSAQER